MARLIIKSESRPARSIDLAPGVVRLGRNPTNDFCLDDATVSSRHCEIIVRDGTVRIRDLGSTNGVNVNGRRVEHAVLKPGDELTLGLSRLSFDLE